jgi:hypothetical protein
MTIMTTDSSATVRREAPHTKQTTKTATIMDALTRRAQAILNDNSIDPQSRAIIRYATRSTIRGWLNSSAALMPAKGSLTRLISRKNPTRTGTIPSTKKLKPS